MSYYLDDLGFIAETGQHNILEYIALKDHSTPCDFAALVVEFVRTY
jgi:hypothetical protein